MLIAGKRSWLRVDWLDGKAQEYLARNDPSFPPVGLKLSLLVVVDSQRGGGLVALNYGAGIGKPYWRVTFDGSGNIRGYKKGIGNEDDD